MQELEGDQMRHLVQALCPAIVGNELVKLGILLAMFGGRQRSSAAAPGVSSRGSIHVLICGDPGLGKSQLLQASLYSAHMAGHGLVCRTCDHASSQGLPFI